MFEHGKEILFSIHNYGIQHWGLCPKPFAVFNHVGLYVSNVDISAAFYGKLLHLDTIPNPWPGSRMKWLSLGGTMQLHLIETQKANLIVPKDNHLAFSVASVDDFIALLKKENISYQDSHGKTGAVASRPDGVKQIYFRDPDGYLVEVNDAKF